MYGRPTIGRMQTIAKQEHKQVKYSKTDMAKFCAQKLQNFTREKRWKHAQQNWVSFCEMS